MKTKLLLFLTGILCFCNSVNASVGAVTPFTSYEAEAGKLGGGATIVSLTSPPTTKYSSPQLEASGHAYVQLTAIGQSVTITNTTGGNITALNLRSCIPDASGGGGITSTIDLYVNGTFRQVLSVNSQQNYVYNGGTNYGSTTDKNPADGDPRDFWNDTHYFITGAAVANGSTITFQKDSTTTASFYYIDVVDLENPPAALSQPGNSLSIVSYGAVSNSSSTDNTSAINSCFSACHSQGKIAWIPPGVWYIKATSGGLNGTGITISGAGPWYSTIYRFTPSGNMQGEANIITTTSCTVENLALDCDAPSRAGNLNNGAVNSAGTNWVVNNVWIQHVTSSFWCAGVNGIAENCRTLSTWADGGNFNNQQNGNGIGMNLVYSNNFVRGTGDDGMAVNSVNYNVNGSQTNYYTIMSNITYVNNTAIDPWGGHNLSIYGGVNIVLENNLLTDSSWETGLSTGQFGPNGSPTESATVIGNTLLRCGANCFSQQQAAMGIYTPTADAYFASNTIIDALYNGIGIQSGANVVLQNNTVNAPGLNGIAVGASESYIGFASGNAVLLNNTIENLNAGETAVLTAAGGETGGFQILPPIQAAGYSNAAPGVQTESCAEGGLDVGYITNGCWALYGQINLAGVTSFVARVASAGAGGDIQIRLDSTTGTLIGTCPVPVTGGWQTWTNQYCSISGGAGCHNVYLVFTGGSGYLFNVQYFALTGPNNEIAASTYNSENSIQTENCAEGGLDVGYISNGSYTEYNNIEMTGVTTFAARVAGGGTTNGGVAGTIQIRTGSATGTILGTCTVAGTGGWQTWVTETCLLTNTATGLQNIYLVYSGGYNVEWFSLQAGQILGLTEAMSHDSSLGVSYDASCSEGGEDVGTINDGNWTEYNQVDLTGFSSFNARVASDGAGGNIQVCMDSPTNTPIGTCLVPVTGGWQTWVTEQCSITPTTGFHNVYLLFNGGDGNGNLFNLEWFTFNY